MLSAFITGVAGTQLTNAERDFLRAARPCGLILFARNCETHDQIRKLVGDVSDSVGSEILVLIDQEGGRVQRLRPPIGRAMPPAEIFADMFGETPGDAEEAAFLTSRLIAEDLKVLGINTNCTPVLDIPVSGADAIIGDRAFGNTPDQVARLGRAIAHGYLAGGVLPVIKHIPGHGRATADSHLALPVVDTDLATLEQTDFAPFRALADLPLAMTAHVVFSALDAERPASISPRVTAEIMRDWIGFDGLLMSDDVSMKALKGPLGARAEAVIAAGSDVILHCNGDLAEMEEVAAAAPNLEGEALKRYDNAVSRLTQRQAFDETRAENLLSRLVDGAGSVSESV